MKIAYIEICQSIFERTNITINTILSNKQSLDTEILNC